MVIAFRKSLIDKLPSSVEDLALTPIHGHCENLVRQEYEFREAALRETVQLKNGSRRTVPLKDRSASTDAAT